MNTIIFPYKNDYIQLKLGQTLYWGATGFIIVAFNKCSIDFQSLKDGIIYPYGYELMASSSWKTQRDLHVNSI